MKGRKTPREVEKRVYQLKIAGMGYKRIAKAITLGDQKHPPYKIASSTVRDIIKRPIKEAAQNKPAPPAPCTPPSQKVAGDIGVAPSSHPPVKGDELDWRGHADNLGRLMVSVIDDLYARNMGAVECPTCGGVVPVMKVDMALGKLQSAVRTYFSGMNATAAFDKMGQGVTININVLVKRNLLAIVNEYVDEANFIEISKKMDALESETP